MKYTGRELYNGKSLYEIHRNVRIQGMTTEHFNLWIKYFNESLKELQVPKKARKHAAEEAKTLGLRIGTDSKQTSLFDHLGGKEVLRTCIIKMSDKLIAHPKMQKFYKCTNFDQFKSEQVKYLSHLYGTNFFFFLFLMFVGEGESR